MGETVVKLCRNCGLLQPISGFHRNRGHSDGRDTRCRPCKLAAIKAGRASKLSQARSARLPAVLGIRDPEALRTAVLGRLRTHYDGRISRLLADVAASITSLEPVDRVQAQFTLLALHGLAESARYIAETIGAELRDADPKRFDRHHGGSGI